MKQDPEYCFLICNVSDDLPVACLDTRKECMEWLGVGRTTLWEMEKSGCAVDGFYLEKVML